MARVRDAEQVFYRLDVTSPSDELIFGLWPRSPRCRIGHNDPAQRPTRRSPQFHMILPPKSFWRIRLRPFEYHFQYLRASETPAAYSYFRLVCGPRLLEDYRVDWTAGLEVVVNADLPHAADHAARARRC